MRSSDARTYELVADAVESIYGVAFRLRFDPAVLRFSRLDAAEAWPNPRIALGEEGLPGTLVGVVGGRGEFQGLEKGEMVLARIEFDRIGAGATELAFVAERSTVLGADGRARPDVRFIGGSIR